MTAQIVPINGDTLNFRKPNKSDALAVDPYTVKQAKDLPVTPSVDFMLKKDGVKEGLETIFKQRDTKTWLEVATDLVAENLGMNNTSSRPDIKQELAASVKQRATMKTPRPN